MKRNLFSIFAIILGLLTTTAFLNFGGSHDKYALAPKPHTDQRAPANYNKIKAPIEVSISRLDDGSSNQVHLVGSVFVRRDFTNLKEDWNIPDGVELISGSVKSTFDINKDETKQFDILLNDTSGNHIISFEAATTDQPAGQNLGAVTNINTKGPELMDQTAAEVNSMSLEKKVRASHLRKILF